MNKKLIYNFLKDLSHNNSREWMDKNRERYTEAKNIWLGEIKIILDRLSVHDQGLESVEPKDTISRINNNRRFHPDRPVYKDNFTFTPFNGMSSASFHISVSPGNSFMGGGIYRPDPEVLNKIREGIDYNGSKLMEIISAKNFKSFYGGLDEDEDALKSAPKNYRADHPWISLLRRKSFTAIVPFNQKDFVSDSFALLAEKAFVIVKPLIDYLNETINFSE